MTGGMGKWRHECKWESEFTDKDDENSVTNSMFLSTDIRVGIKARVDSPLIAKQIFNTFIYPHQLYTIAISSNLRKFFNKNNINSILFWDFSSNNK